MLNTYDFQVEHPQEFSQLAVKDLLFFITDALKSKEK
jgi:hypothetical protein